MQLPHVPTETTLPQRMQAGREALKMLYQALIKFKIVNSEKSPNQQIKIVQIH